LTAAQAAARAQCSRQIIYAAIRNGHLRAAKLGVGRTVRVHVDWLDAYLVALAAPAPVRRIS
jgi:excisionase family DNA binding protein